MFTPATAKTGRGEMARLGFKVRRIYAHLTSSYYVTAKTFRSGIGARERWEEKNIPQNDATSRADRSRQGQKMSRIRD